jgi:hypothetical protein
MTTPTLGQILDKLPALIQAVEDTIPESGKGPDKLNAILQAILVMVPAEELQTFMAKQWPRINMVVTVLVEFYKAVGFFKRKSA